MIARWPALRCRRRTFSLTIRSIAAQRHYVKAYAESVGRARTTVQNEVYAAEVEEAVPNVGHGQFIQLVEIHAAPEWLWSALVSAMVEGAPSAPHLPRQLFARLGSC
ncbi:MAG TPA: hypothetical protein VNY10_14475 [Roseiarcus sp.]|jgi:hypothetical protein|nr:hypothetical protein [Roseiarcus sp.]